MITDYQVPKIVIQETDELNLAELRRAQEKTKDILGAMEIDI